MFTSPLRRGAALAALLTGCADLSLSSLLSSVPGAGAEDGTAYWEGYVYTYPFDGGDLVPLEDGAVSAVDLDGAPLAEAAKPYDNAPAWYQLELAVGAEVGLRVEGGEGTATVWRGRVPDGNALWIGGTVFSFDALDMAGFFADLADHGATGNEAPEPLESATVAHLWGTPLNDEVAQALVTAEMEVVDGDGLVHPVYRLATGRQGNLIDVSSMATPPAAVEIFVAVNLPPGPCTLLTRTADGREVETTWPALGGDVLSAAFYALPEPG